MSLKEFDSSSGSAIAGTDDDAAIESAAAATGTLVAFDTLALERIVPSLTNPRKTFDPVKLQELADSIRVNGVMQPILVRPLPGARVPETSQGLRKGAPRPEFEIVSGERRYRASVQGGAPTIPAMIRAMSDQEVLEAQLVENLQRDDLHPMEEAEGYRRLCDTTGIKKEDIGAKIGKSRSYVYQRLHLLVLGQEARDAFRQGQLDASKAGLLAGISDAKLQLKALKEFVAVRPTDGRSMSVREARDWLLLNVMLKLDSAPFDTQLGDLLAEAGSCQACPKRTGANRDLFAAFDSPDMCTDPKCYGQKASITLKLIKDEAAAQGMDVIAGTDAKRLKPSAHVSEIKGYTRLDAKVEGGGTLAKQLGKDAPKPVLFVDPHTREKIKVLPNAVVTQLLVDKGLGTAKPAAKDKAVDAAVAKAKAAAAFEAEWKLRAVKATDAAIQGGAIKAFSAPVLRALLLLLADTELLYSTGPELQALWNLPQDGDLENVLRHIQAAPDHELGRLAMGFMLATEMLSAGGQPTPIIDMLAGEAGVDVAAIQRAIKAERKQKADEAKAAAAPPGATSQAAPQGSVARKGGKAAAKEKPAGGRKRISEAEAKSGIAEAMQEVVQPAKVVK